MRLLRLGLAMAWWLGCATPDPAAPPAQFSCDGTESGAKPAQQLEVDGLQRTYWLYVPSNYACAPTPLLVDFHGTASDTPELAYQTDSLVAASEAQGFIVVRPRSLSSLEGGYQIYRWDQNPGDEARNERFALELVEHLRTTYAIDPARIYASGFSSGSNMAARFLRRSDSPFSGIGAIAGGLWTDEPLPTTPPGLRVYVATGYRDYLWPYARGLVDLLATAKLPAADLLLRKSGAGHDLYGWHWLEMWRFLDRGERPAPGAVAAPWVAETLPVPSDLLAMAHSDDALWAAGSGGRLFARRDGQWQAVVAHAGADYAALALGDGTGVMGGEYQMSRLVGGNWSTPKGIPDFGSMLGSGWLSAATLRPRTTPGTDLVVAGNWSSALSSDGGQSWSHFRADTPWGTTAQINGLASGPDGTLVAAGYYYLGVAPPGRDVAEPVQAPETVGWWNAVASGGDGHFWAVGDHGALARTSDHGVTWNFQTDVIDADLYAVAANDQGAVVAVGRGGAVLVSSDGGAHWQRRDVGATGFLGAVWLLGQDVFVAGENGTVYRAPLAALAE